jgi:phospholipid/cholesterol/gamma-HCH transport system permease protein
MDNQTHEIRKEDGNILVAVHGRLDLKTSGRLWCELKGAITMNRPKRVCFDLQAATGIDTSGVSLMRLLENLCSERDIVFSCWNLPPSVDQFIGYTKELSPGHRAPGAPSAPGVISQLGGWFQELLHVTYLFIRFVGDCMAGVGWYVRNPHRFPARQVLRQVQQVGADAMPLVIFMSALMGMIMVFQGISSMGPTAPPIYLADMVAIAVTREMAPLLTAVIISGRSGAAFAAAIGTMKINEEIDALSVMDFDITRYLVLPRVIALTIAGPLLIMLADATGIIGGLITCVKVTGLSAVAFMDETRKTLGPNDIYSGFIKGTAFSAIIGSIGCFCGLRTGITPDSVGVETTTAVVSSFFLIIVADGFFAALFHVYGF